jgi:hypothetical protein
MTRSVCFLGLPIALMIMGCTADVGEDIGTVELDQKAGAHFVGSPDCVQSGSTLECSGTIAGLGNRAVTVDVAVTRVCINNGGNSPPGQVRGTSGPIQPSNGRIDFDVFVSAGCPGNMTAEFQSPAIVTVLQGGTVVFTGQISF